MDLAAVLFVARTPHEAMLFQAVNEFNGAVVLDGQLFGKLADGGQFSVFEAANGEKHLVLLRLQALCVRGCVALAQEQTDSVAQFGQGAVLAGGDFIGHSIIISWNDIFCQLEKLCG